MWYAPFCRPFAILACFQQESGYSYEQYVAYLSTRGGLRAMNAKYEREPFVAKANVSKSGRSPAVPKSHLLGFFQATVQGLACAFLGMYRW